MTARRAYGSGSIREKRPGVYELRWWTPPDPFTGKRTQRQETFRGARKAAQQRLASIVAVSDRGGSDATLGALVDTWLATATLAPATLAAYRTVLAHVPEAFMARRAGAVGPPDIAALYRELTKRKVGAPTVRKIYGALSAAYRHGLEWGWVERNPCRGVRPPAVERRTYVIPSTADVRRLLALADTQEGVTGTWVRLMIGTGARRGEILALTWADIDLDHGVLSITGSLGHNLTKGPTKTAGSVRQVALDPDTLAAVRTWRTHAAERALAAGAPLGPWVVSDDTASATPWRPDLATKRMRRMLDQLGIPGARLNDLRHAHATWLLEAGVSARTVAGRIGHTKVSTTIDTYGHMLAGADEAAAATFAAVSRR